MKQDRLLFQTTAFRVVRFVDPLRADFWRALFPLKVHVDQSEWLRSAPMLKLGVRAEGLVSGKTPRVHARGLV